jgi:hypothetical protein
MQRKINQGLKWLTARKRYLEGHLLAGFGLLMRANLNFKTSLFDLAIPLMPKPLLEKALKAIRGESD